MATTLGAILDATAQIAGGAQSGETGHYQGAGGITGVADAWSRVPDAVNPYTHVSFPRAGMYRNPHEERFKMVLPHTFVMRLYFAKAGPTSEQVTNDMLPFVERYYAAFAGKVTLNGTCDEFWIEEYAVVVGPFAGVQWLALEWTCKATEIDTSVLFSA